jgi:Ca2+-binding EF-hand superfamily protein
MATPVDSNDEDEWELSSEDEHEENLSDTDDDAVGMANVTGGLANFMSSEVQDIISEASISYEESVHFPPDELSQIFDMFDIHKTGRISSYQIRSALEELLGWQPSEHMVGAVLEGVRSTSITKAQFAMVVDRFDFAADQVSDSAEGKFDIVFTDHALGFTVRADMRRGVLVVDQVTF